MVARVRHHGHACEVNRRRLASGRRDPRLAVNFRMVAHFSQTGATAAPGWLADFASHSKTANPDLTTSPLASTTRNKVARLSSLRSLYRSL